MKEKAGGWVQISCETVYENPWIRVSHDKVARPNGSEGIYGVVHFKNEAVGVIPVDNEGNTWLVRQSRYTLDRHTWEIPEGGSPAGESPLQSAQRELEEEVGLIADTWTPLLELHTSNSVTDELGFAYLAQGLRAGRQQLEESEDIEVIKLPLEKAFAMAMRGEITDALSLCALFKLRAMNIVNTK